MYSLDTVAFYYFTFTCSKSSLAFTFNVLRINGFQLNSHRDNCQTLLAGTVEREKHSI